MKRTEVVIPAEDIQRQRGFIDKLAALHSQRAAAPRAFVDTYGCQQNVADSQRIMGMLQDAGCTFADSADGADIIVINTSVSYTL